MQVGGQFYHPGIPQHAQSLSDSSEIQTNKTSSSSPEKMKRVAIKIGVTALVILFSPILLIRAGVLATSHLLSKPGQSQWDDMMALIILPATLRKPEKFNSKLDGLHSIQIESTNGSKLDGRILLAAGVPPEVAVKLPTVVIFNPNGGMMEDKSSSLQDYQQAGFNVVVFNYQGVGKSTGKIIQGSDLIDDGKNVVKALIGNGFKVGDLTLRPEAKDVLLDGSSIGGAVAIAVGAEHPEMMLAANRTFTRWIDAAEGLVSKYSIPLFAKLAKVILSQTTRTKIDNVDNMNTRLNSPSHSFTVIESAHVGKGDGILPRKAKLEKENYDHSKAKFQALDDEVDHNSYLRLKDRPVLLEKVQSLSREHHYEVLVQLDRMNSLFFSKPDGKNLDSKGKKAWDSFDSKPVSTETLSKAWMALKEVCSLDPEAAKSDLVKECALRIKNKLGNESEMSEGELKVYELLVDYKFIES